MRLYEALVRFRYAGAKDAFRKVESIFPKTENYKLELLDVKSSRILLRFRIDGWVTTFEVVPDFLHEYQVNYVPFYRRYDDPEKAETTKDQIYGLLDLEVDGKGELLEPEKQQEFKLEGWHEPQP